MKYKLTTEEEVFTVDSRWVIQEITKRVSKQPPAQDREDLAKVTINSITSSLEGLTPLQLVALGVQVGYYYRLLLENNDLKEISEEAIDQESKQE